MVPGNSKGVVVDGAERASNRAARSELSKLGWNQEGWFIGQNHCGWQLQPQIKRHLLLGRKVMRNLDTLLKSKDITLPTKVRIVKVMVFPVVIYECELHHKEV